MKRVLAFLVCFALLFALVLSLASCKDKKTSEAETPASAGSGASSGNGGTGGFICGIFVFPFKMRAISAAIKKGTELEELKP